MRLGHLPPTPAAMARMARFQIGGGAKRAIAHAIEGVRASRRGGGPACRSGRGFRRRVAGVVTPEWGS